MRVQSLESICDASLAIKEYLYSSAKSYAGHPEKLIDVEIAL
jgi:hypothetical protein